MGVSPLLPCGPAPPGRMTVGRARIGVAPGIGLHGDRRFARTGFLARLGRHGDQLQEWDLTRRGVRQSVIPGLADLWRVRAAALFVVTLSCHASAARAD
jgi:hypothetical protein